MSIEFKTTYYVPIFCKWQSYLAIEIGVHIIRNIKLFYIYLITTTSFFVDFSQDYIDLSRTYKGSVQSSGLLDNSSLTLAIRFLKSSIKAVQRHHRRVTPKIKVKTFGFKTTP